MPQPMRQDEVFDILSPCFHTTDPMIHVPINNQEYDETVSLLDFLIDEVGEDEAHPLASLMEVLGVLIEKYEDERVPEI